MGAGAGPGPGHRAGTPMEILGLLSAAAPQSWIYGYIDYFYAHDDI